MLFVCLRLTIQLLKAMLWRLLLTGILSTVAARDLKNIEHTPLHKRNAQNILLDVRDTHVVFSASEYAYDKSVK